MQENKRKRIYLSVDNATYTKLSTFAKSNHYKNECQLVESMVNVMLDRLESAEDRQYDLPDADGEYIDSMFVDMANVTKQADGDGCVAITKRTKSL